MTKFGVLAGINGINAENSLRAMLPSRVAANGAFIYFGSLLLVALAIFGWALLFRRRPRHRRQRHHRSRSFAKPAPEGDACPPRTLAEAGGLPPLRDPGQPPSAT